MALVPLPVDYGSIRCARPALGIATPGIGWIVHLLIGHRVLDAGGVAERDQLSLSAVECEFCAYWQQPASLFLQEMILGPAGSPECFLSCLG